MNLQLKNKLALVAGSTTGIGFGIAEAIVLHTSISSFMSSTGQWIW
jgi:hypothetical protein